MSADPKLVPGAKALDRISAYEMYVLANGGAKVIKAEALKYKLSEQKLRIVSFAEGLRSHGTEIYGSLNSDSFEIRERRNLVAISMLSEINPENLTKFFSTLGKPVYGMSTAQGSLTFFASSDEVQEMVRELHNSGVCKAIASRGRIAMIELTHSTLTGSSRVAEKVTSSLMSRGLDIVDIRTNKASTNIFVDEAQLECAMRVVRELVEL